MGKPTGFKEFPRQTPTRKPVGLRILDWHEIYIPFGDEKAHEAKLREQGARCMDCGIPFCNNGCPLGNIIPEWNDLVYKNRWKDALDMLFKTNNFPEFTGRACRKSAPARKWPSSAPARPASERRHNSTRRGTKSPSSSATTASAGY